MRWIRGAFRLTPLLLLALMIALTLAQAGFATSEDAGDGGAIVAPQQTQAPYTWEQIATIPGAIAATLLIVQYLKLPLDRAWKIPTRWLVLVIAFGLLTLARGMTQGLQWIDLPLLVINAFVVALAAMGAYEVSFGRLEQEGTERLRPRARPSER
jgi:hypothetical protein